MTPLQKVLGSTLQVLERALSPPSHTQWLADRADAINKLRQVMLTTPELETDAEKWREFQAALARGEDRS